MMMTRTVTTFATVGVLLLEKLPLVSSNPAYQFLIPNGDSVFHNGEPWPAVGHAAPQGSPIFNPFGVDFRAATRTWTVELCQMDSDGDGLTNGEELGDPDCVWTPGDVPTRTTNISHPGLVESTEEDDAEAEAVDGSSQTTTAAATEQLELPSWLVVHIACMMLSWGLVLPVGAIMAISFRGAGFAKNGVWFQLHVGIQILGVAFSIAGFVVAFTNIVDHFKDVHHVMGTVVFAGGLAQAVMGFIRPYKPKKGESATAMRTVWEYCHKGFGRIIIVLAWVNIFLGVKLVKNFFAGVPKENTSTIFNGMNAILGIQAALCLVLTLMAIFVKTKDDGQDQNDKENGSDGDMKHTTRPQDDDDDDEQASA
ncbi:cytochrome b561 [Nitzschia inconspicua]|uniref:Cytochrome b561 n=1 Tax=Nitzschia inconspicua TaxID=303405 RepID=A0A9K3LWF9_9STRA|nr:cytochrome b561 [Nitzschia inconspicua]